uniref:Uncharacterized protein n=1 Tax=Sphaerodactylus townsendi TaxID=933632 RepID=A0ACB8FHI7_9SAUR
MTCSGGGAGTEELGFGGGLSGESDRRGDRAGARYAQGGQSSMAEDESDQESERLGEELEAIGGPRLPPGLSPALSSQYYCYRFCQLPYTDFWWRGGYGWIGHVGKAVGKRDILSIKGSQSKGFTFKPTIH